MLCISSSCNIVRRNQNRYILPRCNRAKDPAPNSPGAEREGMGLNGNGSCRLSGKVSIITGGGQGIGRATSIKFAKEGAKVAVCDINMTSVAETLAQVRNLGGEALGFQVDVTDKASIARMVEGVMFAWQRIDTLVNNAGIVKAARFSKMTDE